MSIQAVTSRRESERLSAEVMQYLKSGGQIEKVPGFQKVKPKPLPKERYAAICLGISPWKVNKVARENGIAFRHDPTKINRI